MTQRKNIVSIDFETLPDWDADTSYLSQEGFEERFEQYRHGDFGYIGIRAKAQILVNGTLQQITSGGLWGIESDSDPDWLASIQVEQLKELKDELQALGFSDAEIAEHDPV